MESKHTETKRIKKNESDERIHRPGPEQIALLAYIASCCARVTYTLTDRCIITELKHTLMGVSTEKGEKKLH